MANKSDEMGIKQWTQFYVIPKYVHLFKWKDDFLPLLISLYYHNPSLFFFFSMIIVGYRKKKKRRNIKYGLKIVSGLLSAIISFSKKYESAFILSFTCQLPVCLLCGSLRGLFWKCQSIVHLLDGHTLRWKEKKKEQKTTSTEIFPANRARNINLPN